jgi:hypothetical protein
VGALAVLIGPNAVAIGEVGFWLSEGWSMRVQPF